MILKFLRKYLLKKVVNKGLKIGTGCKIYGYPNFGSEPHLITLGKNVIITNGVKFVTHDGGRVVVVNAFHDEDIVTYGTIVIEDNCFIGINSIIMPRVTIGTNSIVGAGSIVTKNVPPNSVVAGIPAKFICTLDEYYNKMKNRTLEAKQYIQK